MTNLAAGWGVVSGITGAGLQAVVMVWARRLPPWSISTPLENTAARQPTTCLSVILSLLMGTPFDTSDHTRRHRPHLLDVGVGCERAVPNRHHRLMAAAEVTWWNRHQQGERYAN